MNIDIQQADALLFSCDVLALKYAQELYGVDRAVVNCLFSDCLDVEVNILPTQTQLVPTEDKLTAPQVLFVGVEPLYDFQYKEIRQFTYLVLKALSEYKELSHLALTLHGMGYGLQLSKVLLAELAGLHDAIAEKKFPIYVKRVSIVENHQGRSKRLQDILLQILPSGILATNTKLLE